MKNLVLLAAYVCLTFGTHASENRLRFEAAGFSIAPLEASGGDAPYTVLMMFLPPSDDFAPNVGVQIQPYEGTIRQFAQLSAAQFKAADFTILEEKITRSEVIWEYTGMMQGKRLHWYSRAVSRPEKVYLVTATAADSQWKSVGGDLKLRVESFKLD